MIASDDKNPNFVGAHNPDDRLHVVFYTASLPNEFETKKQGRPIFYECDMVKITVPGNQLNNVVDFVNDSHKERFPRQWAHYMNNKKADADAQIIGTPITEWSILSKSQADELKALGFRTVDNIAAASDSQLQVIGMRAGMQPYEFRARAQRFLQAAKNEATVNADAERIAAAETRAAEAERAIQELRAQMAAMQERTKPGRKPKQEVAA